MGGSPVRKLAPILIVLVLTIPGAVAVLDSGPGVAVPCTESVSGLGCRLWGRSLPPPEPRSTLARSLAVHDDVVAVSSSVQGPQSFHGVDLRALDAATGAERWALRDTARSSGTLAFADDGTLLHGTVLASDPDARLEARRASDGALLWSTGLGDGYVLHLAPSSDGAVYAAIWRYAGLHVTNVAVAAVRVSDGTLLWMRDLDALPNDYLDSLVLLDGVVMAPVHSFWEARPAIVFGLDRATGGLLWERVQDVTPGASVRIVKSLAVGDAALFVGDTQHPAQACFSDGPLSGVPSTCQRESRLVFWSVVADGALRWSRTWTPLVPTLSRNELPHDGTPATAWTALALPHDAGALVAAGLGVGARGVSEEALLRVDAATGAVTVLARGDDLVLSGLTLVDGGRIVVGVTGEGFLRVQARDVATGALLWESRQTEALMESMNVWTAKPLDDGARLILSGYITTDRTMREGPYISPVYEALVVAIDARTPGL